MRLITRLFQLTFIVGSTILFMPRHALAQNSPCSTAQLSRTAAAVRLAREKLLALPMGDTDVSFDARRAISQMKARINDMIIAEMQCLSTSGGRDPARIEQDLAKLNDAFKLPEGVAIKNEDLPKDFGKYGFDFCLR